MAILAAAAALFMSPAAASTIGTFNAGTLSSPDSVGFVSSSGAQWNFGVPISSVAGGADYLSRNPGINGGHSLVNLIGSTACDTVAPLAECLVGTIRYTNRVNVGPGSGQRDLATGSFVGSIYNLVVNFALEIDRSTNRSCPGNAFGCADQWFANITSTTPGFGFRTEGSGGFVNEEESADIRIYWIRPASNPEVEVVPLPASVFLLGAGIAGLAALRRRTPRA